MAMTDRVGENTLDPTLCTQESSGESSIFIVIPPPSDQINLCKRASERGALFYKFDRSVFHSIAENRSRRTNTVLYRERIIAMG